MAVLKLTYPNKTNNPSDPDSINKFHYSEANEIKDVAENHADEIELLKTSVISSTNPFYGKFETLSILQATYPTGTTNGWAIIDAGTGITPQIAYWDDITTAWIISATAETIIYVDNYASLPAPGTQGKTYIDTLENKQYHWYNNQYNLIVGNSTVAAMDKIKLKSDEANKTSFVVPGKPLAVLIIYNDAVLTEGYSYTYNATTAALELEDGIPLNAELIIFRLGVSVTKQVVVATQDNQTIFNYSGAPAYIMVIANDGFLAEDAAYTHTNYSTGNSVTLTEGVPSDTSVAIIKF